MKSEYVKLGKKASHGCIRLPYYDAKWLQDKIPKGTLVNIDKI
nr:L,D-transpeptidase family protein [Clostridium sporogenes]